MLPKLIIKLLEALFIALGRGIIRIVYGKEGWRSAEALKKVSNALAFFLTVGLVCWGIGIYVLAAEGGRAWEMMTAFGIVDKWFVFFGVWSVLFPVIVVLWIIYARKKTVPALIEEAAPVFARIAEAEKKLDVAPEIAAAQAAKAASWTCTCGRAHPQYVSCCPCGVSKQAARAQAAQRKE